jgi:gliding motility-associated-like protein
MKNFNNLIFKMFFSIIMFSETLYSQENKLEVISSAGTFATSNYGSMAWTIGEVTIDTYSNSNHFLTQGFHQPSEKETIVVDTDFFIPEGFSPNDDLINDVFFIRGINKYPKNSIEIFNRWGNLVFEAAPYVNQWDGTTKLGLTVGSDELPVGTYFYLLNLGNGGQIIKGTIYLNR